MTKLTNRQKLDLIDYLCAEMEVDSKIRSKIGRFAGEIYTIAHFDSGCKNPHDDWRKKWSGVYHNLKKNLYL